MAAHSAVALEPAPHQMRSRRPSAIRLEPQQARRVRKHRPRIGLGEALAAQHVEKHFGVAPRHVGVGLAFRRRVAEVAPAVDHLLGRAAADAELQAPAADDVGCAGVLRHVQRVLVAHVDDRGADLDALGPRADGGEERKRRAELAGVVMHAEERAVGAEFLGGDREIDRLQQRVGRRSHFRLRRRGPMAEGEEADLFHEALNVRAVRQIAMTGWDKPSLRGAVATKQSRAAAIERWIASLALAMTQVVMAGTSSGNPCGRSVSMDHRIKPGGDTAGS